MNFFVHTTFAILSSTPTNSDSVELRAFTFCFVELLQIAPFPSVKVEPVWLFISACTANAASIYHVSVWKSSASKVSRSSIVANRNPRSFNNFFQSP